MDFSKYERSNRYYGGSERKIGILIGESEYMLKFQKITPFGVRYNHISEFLGSRIFGLFDFPVQEVYLGTYEGEPVVACKNFIEQGEQFVPFNDVGESTLDRDKEVYQYSYEDIMQMLSDNTKLTDVQETISLFWDMFIVDALLGNFDRHGSNWGFIKKNNKYRLAPIFDNGLSLFCFAGQEDLPTLAEYAKTRTNPYYISFEEVCAAVMGTKQKEQLRRMIGFKFTRHPKLNLPEEHLVAVERVLENRVRELLEIPVRTRKVPEKVR